MDYTKTDQQLKNIGDGLREIDAENNFLIFLRGNAKYGEIYTQVMGDGKNLAKMIAMTMLNQESFRNLIFEALGAYSVLRLHTESDCKKCKDADCKARKDDCKNDTDF